MKAMHTVALDLPVLKRELDELEAFLNTNKTLQERAQVLPFFKARPVLTAAIGMLGQTVTVPDQYAHELNLFGDFAADAASGDSQTNGVLLIEFEDALPYSVFATAGAGKVRPWSRRFEHGVSQLTDWVWRLSEEAPGSTASTRIFRTASPQISLLLVIGRDSDLTDVEKARLRWRTNHVRIGPYQMSCLTFDQVLSSLRRRVTLALDINALP
jgi:hypothetical protein